MRTCEKCGETLPEYEFYDDEASGIRNVCKACRSFQVRSQQIEQRRNPAEALVGDTLAESGIETIWKGAPDAFGCDEDGPFAIEVKREGDDLKPVQRKVFDILQQAGLRVFVVDVPGDMVPSQKKRMKERRQDG
jgi:hypothetical protein